MIYICRLTCASWLPSLRVSRSELGWDIGSELGFSVGMVLGSPIGYPLGHSINMLLVLELGNSFFTWGLSLVGFSLGTLAVLVVGTREGYLFVLSLVLPLGPPT